MRGNEQIRITNSHDSVVIDIEGTIGVPESWQFEDPQQRIATYEKFRETVKHIEDIAVSRVVVNIRSTGGDVNDALLIYEALTSLDAAITTRCWGYVASAATVIAQAASDGQREISPNSLYLIHKSTCSADGNANELEQRAELLRKSDERLSELYARRSGRDAESFTQLMAEQGGDGRWLNAKEVIEMGLADCEIDATVATEANSSDLHGSDEEQVTVAEKIANALSSVRTVISKVGKKLVGKNDEDDGEIVEEGSDEELEDTAEVEVAETEAAQDESEATESDDDDVEEDESEDEDFERVVKSSVPKVKNGAPTKAQKSLIAFEEGQRDLKQSKVDLVDDPSLVDITRSDNHNAYEQDARRMRGVS